MDIFFLIFRETYLNSYLVGEGLSGFIPSVAALIQGVGGNPECQNVTVTNNETDNTVNIGLPLSLCKVLDEL